MFAQERLDTFSHDFPTRFLMHASLMAQARSNGSAKACTFSHIFYPMVVGFYNAGEWTSGYFDNGSINHQVQMNGLGQAMRERGLSRCELTKPRSRSTLRLDLG
jgi:hypothetical protein